MSKQEVCRNSFPNVSVSIFTVPSSAEWAGVLVPKSFFQLRTQMRMWQVTHTPPSCQKFLTLGYLILVEKAELLLCFSDVGKTKYFQRLKAVFAWPKF